MRLVSRVSWAVVELGQQGRIGRQQQAGELDRVLHPHAAVRALAHGQVEGRLGRGVVQEDGVAVAQLELHIAQRRRRAGALDDRAVRARTCSGWPDSPGPCGRISLRAIEAGTYQGGLATTEANGFSRLGVWFAGEPQTTRLE